MSFTTCLYAQLLEHGGDYASGRQAHLEATRLAREAGYPAPIHRAASALGWNALLTEDYDAAREALAEILGRISPRALHERMGVGTNLAWAELFLANYDDAGERLLEALRLARDFRHKRIAAETLIGLAATRAAAGSHEAPIGALWGAGRTLLHDCGEQATTIEKRAENRWLVPHEQEYRPAYELGTVLSFEEAIDLALPS